MDNPWATDWDQPTKHSEWPHRTVWTENSEEESVHAENPEVDDWDTAWGGTEPSTEKEELDRAVPPPSLASLLHHCQQVSQEIWPPSENDTQDDWRSGFDNHADITALLAQLLPPDSSLPPSVQFSATATVKAMNEALKLTRHSSAAASSPLSRLLASKGSLEWEKSVKANQDVGPETTTAHVGWRVVEKEDRLNSTDDSKPKKATGGLLSFWNRRASATQVETAGEPSPGRPSLESLPVPPPPPADTPPTTVIATTSAVSRFLNRFSRIKGPQHASLALSADDLEFLSDVVPSASDPPDEDINDNPLGTLLAANHSSPLPPRLPPPIPPPPRQPTSSSRPSSALGFGAVNGSSVVGSAMANHAPNVPVLVPPLSPKSPASLEHTKSPPLFLKDATSTVTSGPIRQWPLPGSQPDSWSHSFFTPPPHQKTPPLLSIPPLLPPPPVSPPQTPRPSTLPSITSGFGQSSAMVSSLFPESHDSDEEFSAFESFPPSAPAPFPSSEPHSSQDPPSPPPRRAYEHTHYPSSSSASSVLSPASQTSLDKLCITGSSISASLDSFDDFVSPPSAVQNRKHTPSPPPLPLKRSERPQPSRVDTFPSRVYHTHNPSQSFASPTVHTSLLDSASSMPSVSDAEHQRTQTLVNHAASRGGTLWPNSPVSDEPQGRTIPPPSTSRASSKQFIGEEEGFDLLGDGDTLGGGLDALPTPINVVGGVRGSVSHPAANPSRIPFEAAGDPGKGYGFRNQLQPSLSPLSASTPIRSFSPLATPVPLTATNPGSLQPTKPKQMGGLSAQDLSFFEGL